MGAICLEISLISKSGHHGQKVRARSLLVSVWHYQQRVCPVKTHQTLCPGRDCVSLPMDNSTLLIAMFSQGPRKILCLFAIYCFIFFAKSTYLLAFPHTGSGACLGECSNPARSWRRWLLQKDGEVEAEVIVANRFGSTVLSSVLDSLTFYSD